MPQGQSDDGSLSPDKRTKLVCRVLLTLVVEFAMEMRKESSSIKGSISESTYRRPHEHVITLGILALIVPCHVSPIDNDRYYLGTGNTIGLPFRLLCAYLLS
jgi:hypothetical protein